MIRVQAERQIKKLAALTGAMALVAAEAFAQERQSKPSRRIVISLPDRKLAVLADGKVIRVFPTAVGAVRTPSPAGSYTIVTRLANPTWYHAGRVVRPGKNNPVGTRWLGLSAKGYGIHGTNAPASIGHNASHGCIRMRNQDVEQLFEMVEVGDSVELYDQRTAEVAQIFDVFDGAPLARAVTTATPAPDTLVQAPAPMAINPAAAPNSYLARSAASVANVAAAPVAAGSPR